MNYGKAVEEVWEWREILEKELESVPPSAQVEYINNKAKEGCAKLGINCEFVSKSKPQQKNEAA